MQTKRTFNKTLNPENDVEVYADWPEEEDNTDAVIDRMLDFEKRHPIGGSRELLPVKK